VLPCSVQSINFWLEGSDSCRVLIAFCAVGVAGFIFVPSVLMLSFSNSSLCFHGDFSVTAQVV
jgi:hypothetical protein